LSNNNARAVISVGGASSIVNLMRRGANNAESRAAAFKEPISRLSDSEKRVLIEMVNKVPLERDVYAAFVKRITEPNEEWVAGEIFRKYREKADMVHEIVKKIPGAKWSNIVIVLDEHFLELFNKIRGQYKNSGYQWFLYNHALYAACSMEDAFNDFDNRFVMSATLLKGYSLSKDRSIAVSSGDVSFADFKLGPVEFYKRGLSGIHIVDAVALSHNKNFKKATKNNLAKAQEWKNEICKRMVYIIMFADSVRGEGDKASQKIMTMEPRIKRVRASSGAKEEGSVNAFVELYYESLGLARKTCRAIVKDKFPSTGSNAAAFNDFMSQGLKVDMETYVKGALQLLK